MNLLNLKKLSVYVSAKDVLFKDRETLDKKMETLENRSRLYMLSGSIVKGCNSNSVAVHSWKEIQDMFQYAYGFTPSDYLVLGVSYTNGDGVQQEYILKALPIKTAIFMQYLTETFQDLFE